MAAYYNEIDPKAAAWLRELIKQGHIAPGVVDERSIVDIRPDELRDFTQCHFFAGIGIWSYALRLAGWDDNRPVWTGSCPCQPFSAAGKGAGFDDERHLWPAFHFLIEQCRPYTVFGEQVASKDGLAWLDLVHSDMEAAGYAFAPFDICAAGFGAPHIRQRLFWVANNEGERSSAQRETGGNGAYRANGAGGSGITGELEHTESHGREPWRPESGGRGIASGCSNGGVGKFEGQPQRRHGRESHDSADTLQRKAWTNYGAEFGSSGAIMRASPTNGHWRDADWLLCRDGKWRPVESLNEPMADGVADSLGYLRIGNRDSLLPLIEKGKNRVMRLRAYGNGIVAPQAEAFIRTFMEVEDGI